MNNNENETSYYCGNCGTYNLYGSCTNCEWRPNYDYFDFNDLYEDDVDINGCNENENNENGYNENGYNENGYNENGYEENGYDSQGYDRSGHTTEYYQDEDESDSIHEFDEDGNDLTWMNRSNESDSTRFKLI